ncbi:hypothetical protein Bca4012_090861 [Brassica carinata]|uniref:(rape) hypothetical protein n=1 Tax=Brassica napus TaxID=3708 RepID=A0A816SAR7_BRANA|nr:unnamed protein product [Brassica napus]
MEFVSTLAPSSRISTEEARGSSSPPDPTMSNKHGCSGRSLESDLHNQLLCRSQFPSLHLLLTSSDLLRSGGSSLIKKGDFTLRKSSSRFLISAKPHLLRFHSLAFHAR